MAQLLNLITARKAGHTLGDCFTIGIETGIQNAQIAVKIVQTVYLSRAYIFPQQFFLADYYIYVPHLELGLGQIMNIIVHVLDICNDCTNELPSKSRQISDFNKN